MTDDERECFKNRAQMVLDNLRLWNSGQDIHEVGSMRNIATLILSLLDQKPPDDKNIEDTLCRLEARTVEFFKKKFDKF